MDEEGGTGTVRLASDPAEWFAHRLRLLFEAVANQLPNALDPTQIEGIHDMRVASRRLRSALRDVELILEDHPAKTASKGFKALADALGAVRDEDVAIDELGKLSSECDQPRIRDGITMLTEARRQERELAFTRLKKDLSVDFQQDLRHRFEVSLAALMDEFQHKELASVPSIGRDVVTSRLEELGDLAVGIHDPFDWKTLHQARIATKRLRYAIDLFAECWGEPIKPFSKELARMQGYLGDAHDRDEWIDALYKLVKTRTRSNAVDHPEFDAAVWLISEFVKERTKDYRDALRLWSEWRTSGFGRSLLEAIAPK